MSFTKKELGISDKTATKAVSKYADLQVQSMMFDMDIDVETWSLVPKAKDETPIWIKRWRENRESADFDELMDIDR